MDRHFRAPRKIRRRPDVVLSAFLDATPGEIARCCLVSRKTALDWMAGRKRPSDRSLLLFDLLHRRRVLAGDWRGWCATDEALYSPDGWRFRPGALQALYWLGPCCPRCGDRFLMRSQF